MNRKRYLGIVTAVLAAAFSGTAMAQLPGLVHSGSSPQSSGALVTLAIPSVVGVNVAHNFVLDFNSGVKCWGTTGAGAFPQAASGNTTYTFAVNAASIASSVNVACPAGGAQPDVATVQVLSSVTGSRLTAGIVDGGQGAAPLTAFTALIADIFSATRLSLSTTDTCGTASVPSPRTLTTSVADYVSAIPVTGWANCNQKLSLMLASTTPVKAGTATGTLTFTITNP